ncbi:MAG TPA: restriction endonuclease [Candidatus Saccharimonadales bacterium]|nr:restriction endonuclease [Candidatus Saccharimonadales bacterium]
MNLNDALKQFEAVEANLGKLDQLWKQIVKLLPSVDDLQVENEDQYLQLKRSFEQIAKQMPKIDGFDLKVCLEHPDDIFRSKVDYLEVGEFTDRVAFDADLHRQAEALGDYRFRVESKRRELARQAIQELCVQIETKLEELRAPTENRQASDPLPKTKWDELATLFKSIDALIGKSLGRPDRWNDIARHLSFGQKKDYDDIVEHDWPNIRQWVDRALYDDSDPIPVTATDLGELVASKPRGPVATELNWNVLSPADFERLVFNVIDHTREYENPKWLTHTNAPDRGRDLSVERVLHDSLAGSRKQRVILACKHTESVSVKIVSALQAQMKLWESPKVDELIIVTTGRFTTDAIDYIEKHNNGSDAMRIEMWPNSHLERLLARRPELIAEFRLRN